MKMNHEYKLKLKELGVYDQFVKNRESQNFVFLIPMSQLNYLPWNLFIECAFVWSWTEEGKEFWNNI